MKIATFSKNINGNEKVVERISSLIKEYGYINDDKNPDIVFVVGGDGTFLRAVHHYIDSLGHVSFIGIRTGSLGFYYDFIEDELPSLFEQIKNNELIKNQHHLLECELNGKIIYAINEIRFENPFHTLVCKVKVNDEDLETFHGNGLLVCNELGSTGYNKSLGGAVLSQDTSLIELTEIATIQNNAYRSLGSSLILSRDKKLSFAGDFNKIVIGYDHLTCDSNQADSINVYSSDKEVTLLRRPQYSNIETLKRSFVK